MASAAHRSRDRDPRETRLQAALLMSEREREMFDLIRSIGRGWREIGGITIIIEGAVDRFCGRPLDQNPYVEEHAPEWSSSWREGWLEADFLLEQRGQAEARRWLEESG